MSHFRLLARWPDLFVFFLRFVKSSLLDLIGYEALSFSSQIGQPIRVPVRNEDLLASPKEKGSPKRLILDTKREGCLASVEEGPLIQFIVKKLPLSWSLWEEESTSSNEKKAGAVGA